MLCRIICFETMKLRKSGNWRRYAAMVCVLAYLFLSFSGFLEIHIVTHSFFCTNIKATGLCIMSLRIKETKKSATGFSFLLCRHKMPTLNAIASILRQLLEILNYILNARLALYEGNCSSLIVYSSISLFISGFLNFIK
jgi:hypothetical protein